MGVVMADMSLNLPDFRSAERTFQLLTQAAGRAGRGTEPGRVVIQTFAPHHYSIRAAEHQDYARFMRRELDLRRELGYPPFCRLAMVRIEGADAAAVEKLAGAAALSLSRAAALRVLGPAPAPIERIAQRYRWQLMVKAASWSQMRDPLIALRDELRAAPNGRKSSSRSTSIRCTCSSRLRKKSPQPAPSLLSPPGQGCQGEKIEEGSHPFGGLRTSFYAGCYCDLGLLRGSEPSFRTLLAAAMRSR